MKKILKYTLIVLGWIILGIIVLLLLASLLLQTRPVKNKLANFAESQAQNFINGNLTIGKIDGNFFTGIVLEDVLLEYENDTLAFISEISAEYNLLPLLKGKVEVANAQIDDPYFYLEQYNDSTWNFQKVLKPVPEKTDSLQSSGSMALSFPDFRINNGLVITDALDTIIPQKIKDLNTHLSFQLDGNEMTADLKEFNLVTEQPGFTLNQLSLEFKQDSLAYELNNFRLKTAKNQLTAQAEYEPDPPQKGSIQIESEALHLKEFEYFLPNLKIPAKPIVTIDAEMRADSVRIILELKDENQKIALNAKSSNLAEYLFEDNNIKLDYSLEGQLDNINIGYWMGNPEIDYEINGNISANGRGIDPATAELLVKADLGESVVENKRFKSLIIDLEMFRGNLQGIVEGQGEFGEFSIEPDVKHILDYPVYDVRLITRNLDLSQLLGNDTLKSDINLTAEITGESFEPEKISAQAKIMVSESGFQEFIIDTLFTESSYRNENLLIDTLGLLTQDIRVSASGNYNMNGSSDVKLAAKFSGLEALQQFLPDTNIITSGNLQAHLAGTKDSLTLDVELNLDSTIYQDFKIQEAQLDATANIAGKDTSFNAQVNAFNFTSQGFQLDSISATAKGNLDSLYATAKVSNSYLGTQIKTGFVPGSKMKFNLDEWLINYKNQEWALQQSSVIRIDSITYSIENLRLATSSADSAQYIEANGTITRRGEENFTLKAANIDVNKLAKTLEQEFEAEGLFDIELDISGTAKSPIINSKFNVEGTRVNEYNFTNFNGSLNFENNELRLQTLIVPQDSGKFNVDATLP
ncbi:MAG TPA: AsmA family protein, partial [Prolixibacteraceae bacterium]|nr:AsmA family protein [Prolixibacteraceae bacterium]